MHFLLLLKNIVLIIKTSTERSAMKIAVCESSTQQWAQLCMSGIATDSATYAVQCCFRYFVFDSLQLCSWVSDFHSVWTGICTNHIHTTYQNFNAPSSKTAGCELKTPGNDTRYDSFFVHLDGIALAYSIMPHLVACIRSHFRAVRQHIELNQTISLCL